MERVKQETYLGKSKVKYVLHVDLAVRMVRDLENFSEFCIFFQMATPVDDTL